MSDPTGGNEVFYGLSVVEWSIIGAVSVFFMLLVDRWVHCFRRCTRLCRCKDDRPPLGVDPSEQEVQQPGFTRTYDRDFETGWHVVGLSDETKDEDVHLHRQVQHGRAAQTTVSSAASQSEPSVKMVAGVAMVGGIQTE